VDNKSLASLYNQGVKIDWQGFDRGYVRNKLQLPTYPFQRQSYWLEKNEQVRALNSEKVLVSSATSQAKTKLDYYQIEWQKYLQSVAVNNFSDGKWIIFGDANNLGTEITRQLAAYNQDYLLVPDRGDISTENNINIDYYIAFKYSPLSQSSHWFKQFSRKVILIFKCLFIFIEIKCIFV